MIYKKTEMRQLTRVVFLALTILPKLQRVFHQNLNVARVILAGDWYKTVSHLKIRSFIFQFN